jgi:AraC family transcriptional regulator of adaptative response/methylated-DNA-[protein]-cysteine methyltransferase
MMAFMALDADRCWRGVQSRDVTQDGAYLYGVLTTGVYCRPGCPSRLPRRENVRFYKTTTDAERDGLRPCLRCRPSAGSGRSGGGDPLKQKIGALCRFIERNAADRPLTLADLAREATLSPSHLQRSFKAIVGVSPKEYAASFRLRKLKAALRDGASGGGVTGAIFEAGFGSLSRVYERSGLLLGMTPAEYRAGGDGVEITHGTARTPMGLMLLAATSRGLCFLQFGESAAALREALQAEYPRARLTAMTADPVPARFREWTAALNRYMEGQDPDLRLPVHIRATAFQIKVWKYLQSIPSGAVRSYGEVAEAIGQPRAVRAVAGACASNQVALAIPCHRVILGTGELGGYRWGIERKRALLERERDSAAAGD